MHHSQGQNSKKKFWGGAQPPSQTLPLLGEGHPLPRPYPPRGLRPLDRPSPTQPPPPHLLLTTLSTENMCFFNINISATSLALADIYALY